LNFPPGNSQDLPNADWGNAIARLNAGRPICHTRLSSETETGVAYQCSNP
jgi:hypothetical protein